MTCVKCGAALRRGYVKFCSNKCRRVDLLALFCERVDRRGKCWLWTGSRTDRGYGQIEVTWPRPRRILAHRLSWELHRGDIPDGLCVLHKCDNPPCCNPEHLFLGTRKDNINDRELKGRSPRGEATHNAVLTDETVRRIVQLRRSGMSYRAIQRELGVGRGPVCSVLSGRSWRHITNGERVSVAVGN